MRTRTVLLIAGVVGVLAIAGCAKRYTKTRRTPSPPPLPPGLKFTDGKPSAGGAENGTEYAPTDFALTGIRPQAGNRVVLTWINGTPPFQLQSKRDVLSAWEDFGPVTTLRSATNVAPYGFTKAFFRVRSVEALTGTCRKSWHLGGVGSQDNAFPSAVKEDRNGDVLVVGTFVGTVNLGGANFTTAPVNVPDMFIAKYSGTGAHIWSKRIGGIGNDQANGLAIDSGNNIVVVGSYLDSVDFGGVVLTNASVGGGDIFVAKFNPAGALLWAKRFGGTATEQCKGVALDSANNIFITGSYGLFGSPIDFGGGPLPGGGFLTHYEFYVAKLSPSGGHVWSRGFGGLGHEIGNAIAVDAIGDVAVCGEFQQTASFGGPALVASAHESFVAKYLGANGTHLWSRSGGGTGEDYGRGIAFDTAGNVVETGDFQGTANFGGTNIVSANGQGGMFVAKYASAGGQLWTRGFSAQTPFGIVAVHGVAVDASSNIVLTGGVSGVVDFDGVLLGFGSAAVMMVKLNGFSGTRIWARQADDLSDDYGLAVAIGADNGVIISGNYSISIDFGCGAMQSPGGFDGFVVNLSP